MLRLDVIKFHFSSADSASEYVSTGGDTVGYGGIISSMKLFNALYIYYALPRTRDFCSHSYKKILKIDNLRFLCGIPYYCSSLCGYCCHHNVFCRANARKIQHQICTFNITAVAFYKPVFFFNFDIKFF
jgi:hypothetical protein